MGNVRNNYASLKACRAGPSSPALASSPAKAVASTLVSSPTTAVALTTAVIPDLIGDLGFPVKPGMTEEGAGKYGECHSERSCCTRKSRHGGVVKNLDSWKNGQKAGNILGKTDKKP